MTCQSFSDAGSTHPQRFNEGSWQTVLPACQHHCHWACLVFPPCCPAAVSIASTASSCHNVHAEAAGPMDRSKCSHQGITPDDSMFDATQQGRLSRLCPELLSSRGGGSFIVPRATVLFVLLFLRAFPEAEGILMGQRNWSGLQAPGATRASSSDTPPLTAPSAGQSQMYPKSNGNAASS